MLAPASGGDSTSRTFFAQIFEKMGGLEARMSTVEKQHETFDLKLDKIIIAVQAKEERKRDLWDRTKSHMISILALIVAAMAAIGFKI